MKMTSIFKKASIFAVATILALLMVVSVLPAVFAADNEQLAEGAPTETLAASNITLSGNISMTYYFKGLEGLADTDYIQITVPNQNGDKVTSKVYFSEIKNTYDAEKERWAVTVSVAYAQQTDVIKMQWFKNGVGGAIREKSVKDYADKVLDYAQNGTDAQKELYGDSVAPITNMLNTGAMAQVALKYNVDNLANADLFTAGNPVDGMLTEHFYDVPAKESFEDTNANVTFIGGQVFLQSKINLRVYFNCPDNVTTATVSNGKTTKTVMVKVDNLGRKYVGINNIVATNFNERYTVTVDGESYAYSVLDYAVDTLNSYLATEEQKNTAKALYLFYSATMEYTNDSYTAAPADCQHARTHMDKTGKIVCSDCHKAVANAAIKLDVSSNTAKLTAGEEKEIKLTFAINGNVDLTGIIFTPVCDGIDLTFKSLELAEGYFGEFGVNGVVLGENANDTLKAGTFATVTYTAKAEDAGIYKIAIKVRQATVGDTSVEDLSVIATGYAAIEVIPAACESHPNLKYTNAGSKHIIHCDVCQYVEYADHAFAATEDEANGVLTYNSSICSVCGTAGAENIKSTYTIGFTVDAQGNKTEKAPLVLFTPADMAKMSTNRVNKVGASADGSYYTFTNKTDTTSEGYITVFSGTDNPYGVTGKYLMIKYRTNYNDKMQLYYGANNGKTTAHGNDHCFLNTKTRSLVNDGEWQVLILNLNAISSSYFKAESEGSADAGQFKCDYIRFDLFNTASTEEMYVDIAYMAMSDDIMSLASFNGNDIYTVCNSASTVDTLCCAVGSYMASTKTQNPFFTGTWFDDVINVSTNTNINTAVDSENKNLIFAEITSKGDSTSTDHHMYVMGEKNYGTGQIAPTAATTKYVAVMYRKHVDGTRFQWFINSGRTTASGSGDNINVSNSDSQYKVDGQWHFMLTDLTPILGKGFVPADGLQSIRFDYHDAVTGAEGSKLTDIAFIAFFSTKEEACEYMSEYVDKYLGECTHDVTYKSTEDCCEYCSICGEQTKAAAHTAGTEYYSVTADPQREYTDCTVCGAKKVASKVIDSTFKGLTLFTPAELVAKGASNASETVVTENGISFARIVSTNAAGAESTLTLNDGKSNLTGAGKYLAVMLRQSSGNGTFEAWVNDAGRTDHTNGDGKTQTAKNQQYNIPNDNTWHLYILDHGKNTTNGLGWTRLDVLNGASSKAGDTIDIAWAAFFDTPADANAMFAAYINAYDTCDHSDKSKLANIDNVEIDGSIFTATADCNACGKKGVSVTLETNDALKIFNPGELLSLSAAALYHNSGYQLITDDATVGNMPYVRYTSLVEVKDLYFTLGTNSWGPVGKYVAILYRRSSLAPAKAVADQFQFLHGDVGTTGAVSGKFSTKDSLYVEPTGEWRMEILELTESRITDGKLGWTRLDIFNGSQKDAILDIAYVGFFNSTESANAFYADYYDTYHFYHKYDVNAATKGSENGMISINCTDCGETHEIECLHKGTKLTCVMSDGGAKFKFVCNLCGADTNRNETNVAILTPDELIGMASFKANDGKTTSAKASTMTDLTHGDMPFLRAEMTMNTTGESYFHIVSPSNITKTGKYVSFAYRSNNINPCEMFISANGSIASGQNKSIDAVSSTAVWSVRTFDFSAKTHYNSKAGFKAIRWDFNSKANVGNYLDVAYLGFFYSQEEADAFYAAYAETYNFGYKFLSHTDGVTVDSVKYSGNKFGGDNSTTLDYDFSGYTFTATPKISFTGWFLSSKGVKNYQYRYIVDGEIVYGATFNGSNRPDVGASAYATGLGFATESGTGAGCGHTVPLAGYEGKTVTVEVIAHCNDGTSVIICRYRNITIPAAQ